MHFDLRIVSYSPEDSSEATDQEALDLSGSLSGANIPPPPAGVVSSCLFLSLPDQNCTPRPLQNGLSPKKRCYFSRDFAERPRCKELRVGRRECTNAHDQARISKVTPQMGYYAKVSHCDMHHPQRFDSQRPSTAGETASPPCRCTSQSGGRSSVPLGCPTGPIR